MKEKCTLQNVQMLLLLLLLMAGQCLYAQPRRVTGKVLARSGDPMPGVNVLVKGSTNGTATDAEGRFAIEVQRAEDVLVLSFIGFRNTEVVVGDRTAIDVNMEEDFTSLEEVVVTALGIRREKSQLTYSTQEVKGDEIAATKETGVLNALTGRVSGVQITSSTGQPGSSSRIVIRGTSSMLGDNEALIVLDGVPINNSETGNAGPGAGVSRFSDIDPAIIESINVLKGSAASALYGSRAARGVVIITTKSGSGYKKPAISFSSQYSIEKPILPEVQNKYALGSKGVYANGEDQKTSLMYGPAIAGLEVNGAPVYNKNPLKEFFRTGKTLTNTLSAQGGSDKSNYFVSYSYLNQEGTVPTTSYKRHSAFAKYHNAFTDKFSATFQFNFVSSLANRVPEGYDLVSPVWTVYTAPHTWNPRPYLDENGNQRVFRYSRNNPYWVLDNVSTESRNNRFLPVVTFAYNPTAWLTVTERLGADMFSEQGKYHESPSSALSTTGIIRDRTDNFRQFNHDLIIEARKQVGEDLGLSLLLGNNVLSSYWQQFQIEGTGIAIENFNNVSNSQRQVSYETHTLTRKVGFYAQANVEYKQMLNLSLTGRYDGSSVLAEENRYYPYGSASLGFIFSELLEVPGVDFGKLRVSYSSVGNDNIGAYSLTTPYKIATNFPFNGQNGFLVSTTLGNPNLVNEKTNEFEAGLEMKVLGGRIGFEVSYFHRKHLDLLTANVPIAPSSGYSTTTLNAGDMTNKGIEALLNLTPVNNAGFRWDVTLNYTRIRNKVIEINGSLDMLNIGQTFAFLNEPYGTIYNYDYERDAAGRIKVDATGLPMLSADLKKIGNIQPDWIGGMLNTLRYKNMSFSFFFDMRKGGDVMNSDNRYGLFYGTPKTTENREPRIVEGVLPDGSPNNIMVDAQDYYQRLNSIASASVEDVTYIKLRNVSLGYELPLTMLSRSPFAKASLSVTGRNLWFYTPHFTGSDPEVSSYGSGNGAQGLYAYNVPTSRSFNFTLAVTLK